MLTKQKKKVDRKYCAGCRDNFYNQNNMGMNMATGRPECWSLATATLERAKDVPIHQPPPYKHLPLTQRPSCYKAQGYVRVKPESLTKEGFWRT